MRGTRDLLPKLTKAGVVDAGALGMYIFFEGFFYTLAGELRAYLPDATLVTIRYRSNVSPAHQAAVEQSVDIVLRSFEEGLAFVTPEKSAAAKAAKR